MVKKAAFLLGGEISYIRHESYDFDKAQHLFLIGDLKNKQLAPFFFDKRIELILCNYAVGENSIPHWHSVVDEYEIIIAGELVYIDSQSKKRLIFNKGDLVKIPSGVCVQRIVNEPTTTIAIKVPSNNEKIMCCQCERNCDSRMDKK